MWDSRALPAEEWRTVVEEHSWPGRVEAHAHQPDPPVVAPLDTVDGARRVRTREPDYLRRERARATGWKLSTDALPDAARLPATPAGSRRSAPVDWCLPPEYAEYTLLPEVRWQALAMFAALGLGWRDALGWHAGVRGPSNHLLASQVQGVNALGQLVDEPDRLARAFGSLLGVGEARQIEPAHHLTFGFTGARDYFGERSRARRTTADAAFLHEHVDGFTELVLVDWTYTEAYRTRTRSDRATRERADRYLAAIEDPDGPVDARVLPFELLTDEPLYQRVRLQLLAHALEHDHVLGAHRVRVLTVSLPQNIALAGSLTRPQHRAIGRTVDEVWQAVLRHRDRHVNLDSTFFLDPAITSDDYVQRYGDAVIDSTTMLCAALGVFRPDEVGDALAADHGLTGEVIVHDAGVRFSAGADLAYPFTSAQLHDTAAELAPE